MIMIIKKLTTPISARLYILLVTFFTINILVFSGIAQSAIIVDQKLLASGGDSFSSFDVEQGADNFSLAASTEITGIEWWGAFGDDSFVSKNFNVRFFNEGSGEALSDSLAFNFSLDGDNSEGFTDVDKFDVFKFEVALTPFFLSSGNYLVSIVSPDDTVEFYWQLSDGTGTNYFRDTTFDSEKSWISDVSGNYAFSLFGNQAATVPEPNTIILVLLAFLGLSFYRTRIKI